MPTVRKGESRSKYVSRCVRIVLRESGTKSTAHAVAKCRGMWEQAQKRKQTSNKELSNERSGNEESAFHPHPDNPVSNQLSVSSRTIVAHPIANQTSNKEQSNDAQNAAGVCFCNGNGNSGVHSGIGKVVIHSVLNQRKRRNIIRAFNPLRVDPTRTTTLRRIFQQALSARFRLLKGKLLRLIVDEDAFGLRKYNQVQSFNQEERDDEARRLLFAMGTGGSKPRNESSPSISVMATLNKERSDEQQSNASSSKSNAASRERGEAASELSGSSGNEASGIRSREGKTSVSQEDYVFALNQTLDREQSDDRSDCNLRSSNSVDNQLSSVDNQLTLNLNKERSDVRGIDPDARADIEDSGVGKWSDGGDGSNSSNNGKLGETNREVREADSGTGIQGEVDSSGRIVMNRRWAFHTNPEKVKRFQAWLQTQIQADILTVTVEQAENAYWTKYVEEGYRKGAGRAFDDVNVAKRAESYGGSERLTGFYEGAREQFLQSSFGRPVAIEKVKLLTGRVFTELKGVTEAMATTITRELADGLVRGDSPRTIARRMIEQGIGTKTRGIQSRALTIARTETIRAHAEGQLDALEQMGVEKIGVMVEWSAAGDDRTCPRCQDLDGIVMKLKEARGIIPRHPSCRCSFLPANVGESTQGQKRSQKSLREAINKSISHDIPKGRVIKGVGRRYQDPQTKRFTSKTKRTLAEQKKRSRWAGADLKPSKARPKPV